MKLVLPKHHWLKELALVAASASFACAPVHATPPAGATDSSGPSESELSLSSCSSDEDVPADADEAPLQLDPIIDPLEEESEVSAQLNDEAEDRQAVDDESDNVEVDDADADSPQDTAKAGKDKAAKSQEISDQGSADGAKGDGARTEPKKADNILRRAEVVIKALPTGSGDGELSLEAQQARDQGECPGGEASATASNQTLNDVPLEQEEHPFDAPAAQSEDHKLDSAEPKPAAPLADASPVAPIETAAQQMLHQRINTCLAYYFTHPENLAKRSPWAVMHTILPFGVETDIVAGNRRVNAIGWMCYNGVCKTQRMFHPTQSGFRTNVGPGVQGHEGQFLAVLAQSSVPRNFPIIVGKTRYTVSDLIRYEMATCREKSELTFKLIGLSHYLSPRQAWRDDRGQVWNLEKLVREEVDQPVVGAACGGTHRLMGLSYSLMMRRRYKEPINGHWARADVYLKDFVQYAWSLQNPDGSFSTDWFEGRANEPDMERKVQTSGHILEWLVFTLPTEDLDDPRLTKAVEFILSQIHDRRDNDWPIGPRGHALRALSLYNQRVFGVPTGRLKSHLAQAGLVKDLR